MEPRILFKLKVAILHVSLSPLRTNKSLFVVFVVVVINLDINPFLVEHHMIKNKKNMSQILWPNCEKSV